MSSAEALPQRRPHWTEILRLLVLVAAALLAVRPFLTARLVGGVDGRWYAYMLRGFTDQIGSGRMPYLIGEGPFAWNGGVHPFRTAPAFMLLGGLWKVLTFGKLGPYTIQHLTVATSAVAGVLGFYAVAARVLVDRRWTAAGFALLYLLAPAWLATIYKADAYMSYMAFGAMPLVLWGNVGSLTTADAASYVALGAGEALLWMCHPPIALLTTIATLFLQAASVVARGLSAWRQAAAGAVAFAVLAAYYFASMSELPPRPHSGMSDLTALVILGSVAGFLAASGRAALGPARGSWLAAAAVAAAVLGFTSFPWLVWAIATTACWSLLVLCWPVLRSEEAGSGRLLGLFGSALAGAAGAEAYLGKDHAGINSSAVVYLANNAAHLGDFLRPLPAAMNAFSAFQPGWGIVLGLGLASLALLWRRPPVAAAFAAAALTEALTLVRVPLVSNFLLGYLPIPLAAISGIPLPLRIMPVLCSFALTAALLAAAAARSRRGRAVTGVWVAAAVLWGAGQARHFVRDGFAVTATAEVTDQTLRPENVMMDRYVYDLLPLPRYYSNGVADPALESRLLRPDGSILVGPREVAAAMEKEGARTVHFVCRPIDNAPNWLRLEPKLTVQAGERLLLRFQFDPKTDYSGYLFFHGEHDYREYHLPDSGQELAFGVGEQHSPVLSLWNSGTTAAHYELTFSRNPGNSLEPNGGHFADVRVSAMDRKTLPVDLQGLEPYHAVVTAPEAALLETFRSALPGYRAYVDGHRVPVVTTGNHLVGLALSPGRHDVELRFVGTARLWAAAVVSGVGWTVLLALVALRALAKAGPRRLFSHRLVRFGAVGVIVTVCFMGFNALLSHGLGLAPSVAFLVAYPPALLLHFTLNKLWTFGDARSTSSRHLAEYFYSVVVTFLIQWPSFLLLQSVLHLPGWAAAGGANVVQMSASYALLRLRVFNGAAPAEENAGLSWHRLILLVFSIAISALLAGAGLGFWGLPDATTATLPGLLSPLPYLIAGNLCATWLWLVFLSDRFPAAGLPVKLLGIAVLGFCGGQALPARGTVVAGGSVSAWYFLVTFMLAACYAALGWKRARARGRPPAVRAA